MSKILKMFSVPYSLLRLNMLKIFVNRNIKFNLINIISPFVSLDFSSKSKICIGNKVQIRRGSKIQTRNEGILQIGNYTFMNYNCMVVVHESVIIGNNVQFGPNVLVYDHDHDFKSENGLMDLKYKTSPIIIGNNVWIGANTIILRGTIIEDNAVVGAGSIVKGHIPKNTIFTHKKENIIKTYKGEDMNE